MGHPEEHIQGRRVYLKPWVWQISRRCHFRLFSSVLFSSSSGGVAKRENGVDVDLICELSTTSYHEISIDIVGRDSKSSPNRCPICEIGRDLYDLDC